MGGVQGSAAPPGFDHDCRGRQRCDEAVALEEPPLCRSRAGRDLPHDGSRRGDALDEVGVSLRIGPFQAARHQGDCVTATGEGRAVSCGGDTERRSRDDGDARSCQFRGELSRHMFAIGGGGTRSATNAPFAAPAAEADRERLTGSPLAGATGLSRARSSEP